MGTTSLSRALRFYWDAKTINSIHSPLFYKLINHITDLRKSYYDDYAIEQAREKLLRDQRKLSFVDLGAGSKDVGHMTSTVITIRELAKRSSSNKYKCKILRNLVGFFQPHTIVELGTNLGIATAYMHAASKSSKLVTVEGVSEIQTIAKQVLSSLGFDQVISVQQSFEDYFESSADEIDSADFVFLDGDHQYASVVSRVRTIMVGGQKNKVLIVDDINWSDGMARAWKEIKQMPGVSTLDLYKMGIVIRNGNLKEDLHIKYIPRILKPLSFGFFG